MNFILKSILSSYYRHSSVIHSRLLCSNLSPPPSSSSQSSVLSPKAEKINVKQALRCQPDDNKSFQIQGWIRSIREHKELLFIDVDDGSSARRLQVLLNENIVKNLDSALTIGSSVSVIGHIISSPGQGQATELICNKIDMIGKCLDFPFSLRGKSHESEELRKWPHLRMRMKIFPAIVRLRSELMNAIHIYMKQNDFVHVTTPLITSNDCEGGGEVFTVKSPFCKDGFNYFNTEAYLTVSHQLHLEAMACCMSRVYSLSTTFRSEQSRMQNKHLSEFTMFEAEEAFVESLDSLMDRVESICKFVTYYAAQHCKDDFKVIFDKTNFRDLDKIANSKYIRLTYADACEILSLSGKCPDFKAGQNLNNHQEQMLLRHFNFTPIFVTHFPANIKPFYMKQFDGQALCFDLLSPICGEVCGGSLREDDYDRLKQTIDETIRMPEKLNWYLDLRRFGNVSHGGFGIGFDRLVQSLTGMKNIKDVTPFPRWYHHCYL